jgi:hypothetical protein
MLRGRPPPSLPRAVDVVQHMRELVLITTDACRAAYSAWTTRGSSWSAWRATRRTTHTACRHPTRLPMTVRYPRQRHPWF